MSDNSVIKISLFIANYERQLRMGVDIRRKGRSNGVCRKDEKGARESRSSIEESTGRNEATSR